MTYQAIIGTFDESILYTDRPTVKVVIKRGDTLLLLNNGLLPGGGVDELESDVDAISRELREELGAIATDINKIGEVIQYRTFLKKRYVIQGYEAALVTMDGQTNPQDNGEALFTQTWLPITEAIVFVEKSIEAASAAPMENDSSQGELYNLMATLELLKRLK
jgi:8-oxo-dGTP pyrophosphatase MutT (NUDIX family)